MKIAGDYPRLLLAINDKERRAFFPDDNNLKDAFAGFDVRHSAAGSDVAWEDELREWRPDVVVGAWSTRALPVPVDGTLPTRYYCHLCGSIRKVVARELLERNLLVTNWGNSIARFVAEAALALTLASLRRLTEHQETIHRLGGWRGELPAATSLFGKRIGIHGFGMIARELVALLRPFRPQLTALDPFVTSEVFAAFDVARMDRLEDLVASNDVVVETCALTSETRGIISDRILACFRPGALFVNIARGQLVDEEALARRVAFGQIAVGLDVFIDEPLPTGSALRGLKGAVLTPHIAGNTPEGRRAAGEFALANLREFAAGRTTAAQISLSQYDRMT